ncbi:MAG: protein translocase subunit SecD, partial [Bacillota bacterium]|nr:protein translocase subunit SecD [Bacillota bacterium]
SAMLVIRNRLDSEGFTEATVTRQGNDQIRVEIPGIENPSEVSKYLVKPAKLEIKDPTGAIVIEGKDIAEAHPSKNDTNQIVVAFKLNDSGTKAFADATTKYIGQQLSIYLDGAEISAPTVKSEILSGEGVIEGDYTYETAKQFSLQLMSGSLPVELEEIELRSISATLGYDALNTSLMAGAIGVACVLIFMLAFYKLPGLVAVVALIVYMTLMIFCLATIPGVQLTLPGVAGIIMSIGVAVDANVIVFERFKEEYRSGKSLRVSVDTGFKRAFRAILDSNVTTLIATLALYLFGTGPIKGFALTLMIGIGASMITAIVVSRGLLRMVINLNITNPKFYVWGGVRRIENI